MLDFSCGIVHGLTLELVTGDENDRSSLRKLLGDPGQLCHLFHKFLTDGQMGMICLNCFDESRG